MKKVTKKFVGQLSGQKDKEEYFSSIRKELNISLPKVGESVEYDLPNNALNGAFLSILDGKNSLFINGKPVGKIKVYKGEESLPKTFSLSMKIDRVSDVACKLSANIQG